MIFLLETDLPVLGVDSFDFGRGFAFGEGGVERLAGLELAGVFDGFAFGGGGEGETAREDGIGAEGAEGGAGAVEAGGAAFEGGGERGLEGCVGGGDFGAAVGDGGIGAAGGEAAGEPGEAAFVVEGVGGDGTVEVRAVDIEGLGVTLERAGDMTVERFGGVARHPRFEIIDAGVDGAVEGELVGADAGAQLLAIGHGKFGGGARGGGTEIGDKIGDGKIDLVTDRRNVGDWTGCDGAGERLFIESPQVLYTTAAASGDDGVDYGKTVFAGGCRDSVYLCGDLAGGTFALDAGGADDDVHPGARREMT